MAELIKYDLGYGHWEDDYVSGGALFATTFDDYANTFNSWSEGGAWDGFPHSKHTGAAQHQRACAPACSCPGALARLGEPLLRPAHADPSLQSRKRRLGHNSWA